MKEIANSHVCRGGCPNYIADGEFCKLQGGGSKGYVKYLDERSEMPCLDKPQRFKEIKRPLRKNSKFSGKVGFIAACYMKIGGTEIWHETLINNMSDVAGFVCLDENLLEGDLSKLNCPTGSGIKDAKELAANCDTLVVWGVGDKLGDILGSNNPKVISVNHCDGRNAWSTKFLYEQEPWTDYYAYLCPTGSHNCPTGVPRIQIHNAPNPERIACDKSRKEIRDSMELDDEDVLIVAFSRISPEKRVLLLVQSFEYLPNNYKLVIAGDSNKHTLQYKDQISSYLSERVKLVGPVDNPSELLTAADLYVSVSEFEGYGLSTAESMLAGVPVVSTKTGLLELEPELARLVDHDISPKDLAKYILEDVEDTEGRKIRADLARVSMTKNHSVDRFVGSWNKLIGHKKVDLTDVTFTIPVRKDSHHRLENLELILDYLRFYFETNILVLEESSFPEMSEVSNRCEYIYSFSKEPSIYRTKCLNRMAKICDTPFIVNYDSDVLFSIDQYIEAVRRLRNNESDMVYPYDRDFVNLDRNIFYGQIRRSLSLDGIKTDSSSKHSTSVGGAVFWRKDLFLSIGGENEYFRTWGYEDNERYARAIKLGVKVSKVNGDLLHISHDRLPNGTINHENYEDNRIEYEKVKRMTKEELESYIQEWKWNSAGMNIKP